MACIKYIAREPVSGALVTEQAYEFQVEGITLGMTYVKGKWLENGMRAFVTDKQIKPKLDDIIDIDSVNYTIAEIKYFKGSHYEIKGVT